MKSIEIPKNITIKSTMKSIEIPMKHHEKYHEITIFYTSERMALWTQASSEALGKLRVPKVCLPATAPDPGDRQILGKSQFLIGKLWKIPIF